MYLNYFIGIGGITKKKKGGVNKTVDQGRRRYYYYVVRHLCVPVNR